MPGHISVLLPADHPPGLLGELEVKWNCWALPCSGVGGAGDVGEMAWQDLSWPCVVSHTIHRAEESRPLLGSVVQGPLLWKQHLPLTFFPSRETSHCFPTWENPRLMDEGQGDGVERVEGRPAQPRRAPCPAPVVCLWILSLQAEEEDPSGGCGPNRPRERYLQRAWGGGTVCFFFWRG